ncbi:MAG: hypothetical protein H0W25_08700 [Acidimicrobiia bacterium]|nr:hypothetical protein [Acidimicrobiia bacterium]
MPDPAKPEPERADDPARPGDEPDPADVAAAEEIAARVAAGNDDRETTREAVEQELAAEGLSEAGSRVGDEMD